MPVNTKLRNPNRYEPGTKEWQMAEDRKMMKCFCGKPAYNIGKEIGLHIELMCDECGDPVCKKHSEVDDETGKCICDWCMQANAMRKYKTNPYPPAGYQWRPLKADERRVTHSGMPIAPAYTQVFLNLDPEAKLEACAKDSKGRTITTPFYKKAFRKGQDVDKFKRIEKWEPVYPSIMKHVMKHLPKSEEAKVLYLVDKSRFRVGGEGDTGAEKKAYGASTLLSEHAAVDKDLVKFTFIGKKGVKQVKIIEDPVLAEMIRKKKSQERLFDTTESKVLSFMRKADKRAEKYGFKVSDFRPLHATNKARELIAKTPVPKTWKEFKKSQKAICEIVAADLGNTATVTKNSYIDPRVWIPWERILPAEVKKAKKKKRSKR
jgi:DNA topoisomerase IB